MKKPLSIISYHFLLLIFNCLLFTAKAQPYVTIPDPNFAAYLKSIVPYAMNNGQLNTSSSAVTTLTSMTVNNKNILNLTGVQYFTSLTWLSCYGNQLTSLPVLPPLLTHLWCGNNSLTSLEGLPNTLNYLQCS